MLIWIKLNQNYDIKWSFYVLAEFMCWMTRDGRHRWAFTMTLKMMRSSSELESNGLRFAFSQLAVAENPWDWLVEIDEPVCDAVGWKFRDTKMLPIWFNSFHSEHKTEQREDTQQHAIPGECTYRHLPISRIMVWRVWCDQGRGRGRFDNDSAWLCEWRPSWRLYCMSSCSCLMADGWTLLFWGLNNLHIGLSIKLQWHDND